MNKHRKTISREIKDIMLTDKFGRMSYKEAKRKWKKGFRSVPINTIRDRCHKRGITFYYAYQPGTNMHSMLLTKRLGRDTDLEYRWIVTNDELLCYRGHRMDIVDATMRELDDYMRDLGMDIPQYDEYDQRQISFAGLEFPIFGR